MKLHSYLLLIPIMVLFIYGKFKNEAKSSFVRQIQESTTFPQSSDSISLKSIPTPFFWVHQPKYFKILSDDAIEIKAGEGTDLYTFVNGDPYVNSAPKLLLTPAVDFIFSAKVKPAFNSLYDGGAIIIYSDSSNWAKILFEQFDEKTWLIGSSVVDDRKTDDSYHTKVDKGEIWLKVAKSGQIFNFYHSLDGKRWNLTRTFHYNKAATLKVGFYAQSPKGSECTVEFSNIRYTGKAFSDFFTGE